MARVGKFSKYDNMNPIYKYGYVNRNGKLVIPCEYDSGANFENETADVYINGDKIEICKNRWYKSNKN